MAKVTNFTKKILFDIEDLHIKGYDIKQIARKLKITPIDVKNGLNIIFAEEMENE